MAKTINIEVGAVDPPAVRSIIDYDDVFGYRDDVSVFWAEDFSDFRTVSAGQHFRLRFATASL